MNNNDERDHEEEAANRALMDDHDEIDNVVDGLVVVEHAQLMSGGGFQVRNSEPHIEDIYPLSKWIEHHHGVNGQVVYRREIIVVRDWEPVSG